jgi:hypothetical protein
MTKEEQEIFNEITSCYYTSIDCDKVQKMALLDKEFLENDEMTKEDYLQKRDLIYGCSFTQVIDAFKRKTGKQIVHATEHDVLTKRRADAFNWGVA